MAPDLERQRERKREWRRANRQRLNEAERDRRARDPQKYRDQQNARRALDRQKVNDQMRLTRQWHTHGMRPEDWAAMHKAQDGRCYLCGDDLVTGSIHVDHDHACCGPRKSCSICRRGLACARCNSIAGWAQDDPDRLQRIARRLRIAKRGVASRMAKRGEQLAL